MDRDRFRAVCRTGLSYVRPLRPEAAHRDPEGWNFGSAWPPSYHAYGRLRALLTLDWARSLHPASVLEIAAGDAALAACLASPGCRVVANDLRADKLRQSVAEFSNGAEIALAPGNVFDLDPARLGRFDLVIACEIIEHVAHAPAFLTRLRAFLNPGGHILLTTPNGRYFRNRLPTHAQIRDFTALEAQQFKPDADGHLFLLTPGELRALARAAKLEVQQLQLWGTPAITGHLKLSLAAGRWAFGWGWAIERLAQRMGEAQLARWSFHMLAVLGVTDAA